MVQCKTVFYTIGVVFLLFFGIPIRIHPPASDDNILFEKYLEKYNKSYKNNDTLRFQKFQTFQETLAEIKNLNSQRKHNLSAIFGVTKFSDLSKDEFIKHYLQSDMYTRIKNNSYYFKQRSSLKKNVGSSLNSIRKRSLNTLPLKVDWRSKGAVGKINNQKNCGACWAFSTIETIESMRAIKDGVLEQLSVQEAIDCDYNSAGCNGGDICSLVYWLYDNDIKIQKETDYPFHLKTETCKLNDALPGVQVADFSCRSYVARENLLLNLLANHGPVAVAINAMLWQNYVGGVIRYHCTSSPFFLNHAVQIVGYDMTAEIPYYIVRNSWGRDFGDHGYLYIAIGNNVCGLAHEVVSIDIL